MSSSVQMITMGCRLNTYESEVMRHHAQTQGLENTIIINTCAVTQEAERQARQAIRRARRDNPEATIIVTGCSAQINPDVYAQMTEVDRVLGNQEKMKASSFSPDFSQKVLVDDIMTVKETAHHLISGFENRSRAFIQIQNGCDHRCTFCTIPYGRGNNRSVPMGEISAQVKSLVAQGCQEIVFTGVDITGYGGDLPGTPTLGQMAKRILNQVPNLKRLRLSSIDPAEIDEDIFHMIAHEPRLMPHFHLSLQSGADLILKRMKRRHLRHHAIEFCEKVRSLRSDVVFGADIIVGFPTETDQHFQDTLDCVNACDLTYLHVFPYSPRSGTPAARMPQVAKDIIKIRGSQLRSVGKIQEQKFFQKQVGSVLNVLFESEHFGHTDHYAPFFLEEPQPSWVGTIQQVLVTQINPKGLRGIPK